MKELFAQKPSLESSSSTVVDNATQHLLPVAGQSSRPEPPVGRVMPPDKVLPSGAVSSQDWTRHGTTRHGYRVSGHRTGRHTRSTSLDSLYQFMTCPMCGDDHIFTPTGVEPMNLPSSFIGPTCWTDATQFHRRDVRAPTFDGTWVITVDRRAIKVPNNSGIRNRRTAGIFLCLLLVVIYLALGNVSF